MSNTFVVSIHGISGQGVETAMNIVAESMGASGACIQSLFFPTQERRGTHIYGILKTDKSPILSKQKEQADFCLLFDSTLEKDVIGSVRDGGTIIINTSLKPNVQQMRKRKIKVFSLDATGIGVATSKKPIPNLAMIGALAKLYNKISLKSVKTSSEFLPKENLLAIDEGFKNVKMVK